jgi:hypothetical protein
LLLDSRRILHLTYTAHPVRFVKGPPELPALPEAACINSPQPGEKASSNTQTTDTELAETLSKTH